MGCKESNQTNKQRTNMILIQMGKKSRVKLSLFICNNHLKECWLLESWGLVALPPPHLNALSLISMFLKSALRVTVNSEIFARILFSLGFYFHETSHMGSFVKIKSLTIGEVILSFTYKGKSRHCG